VLLNPKHGYGANMNPCLDCKIFMVHKAQEWIEKNGFDFIITGEVVGQRPMSQRKDTMPVVARESGAQARLLRPLSAKNLPATLAEEQGWIKREAMHGFSGRNRKPQIALANQYGFEDYASPAGGCCFLTDVNYSNKLVDLWQARGKRDYEMDDIMLLKVGRHIRPRPHFKLIVGREEGENNYLQGYKKMFTSLQTTSHKGPLVLLDGVANDDDLLFAARLTARFSQGKGAAKVTVETRRDNGEIKVFDITPLPLAELQEEWYV
jgi:tRNA-uridine 2-sulfurtransferase